MSSEDGYQISEKLFDKSRKSIMSINSKCFQFTKTSLLLVTPIERKTFSRSKLISSARTSFRQVCRRSIVSASSHPPISCFKFKCEHTFDRSSIHSCERIETKGGNGVPSLSFIKLYNLNSSILLISNRNCAVSTTLAFFPQTPVPPI